MAMFALSAFAQPQPAMVTPSPAAGLAGGRGVNASQATTYHFTIGVGAIQALGAATSGDILLFTTEPGQTTAILEVWIASTTRVRGGGLSAVTARVQGGNNYGTTSDVYATSSATPVSKYIYATGDAVEAAATAVNLHLVSTGDNLNLAAGGQLDVWVTRRAMR